MLVNIGVFCGIVNIFNAMVSDEDAIIKSGIPAVFCYICSVCFLQFDNERFFGKVFIYIT